MTVYRLGQVVLVLWLIYKFVVLLPMLPSYGIAGGIGAYIGGNVADLRTWLLVVGLLLLRTKLRKNGLARPIPMPDDLADEAEKTAARKNANRRD